MSDWIDRRHPRPGPEHVTFDPEALRAAIDEAKRVAPATSLENLVALALHAYLRTAKEAARRGAHFRLRSGERIEGVHPEDVQAALAMVARWGGLVLEGARGQETIARALAAADSSREHRLERARRHRRPAQSLARRIGELVGARLAIHRAGRTAAG